MSAEVIDLTHVDETAAAAAARRAAKRARRARAAAAAPDVIDLSRDDDAAGGASGGGASGAGASGAGGASGGGGASAGVGAVSAPFTCGVCFCDSAPEEGHALFCGHVYCRECLGAHCKAQVGDGLPDAAGIRCPEPSCRAPLTGADVAAVADAPTAACFDALALEKLVQSNSDSMGCCPTPGCTFLFAWDPANRKLQCPLCKHAYCVVCKTDWHRGVRCEDRGEREDEAAFARAAARGRFKKCPKCAVWVEKADGCDSMKCRCGAAFCYRCGSRLDRAHAGHKCATATGGAYYRRPNDW